MQSVSPAIWNHKATTTTQLTATHFKVPTAWGFAFALEVPSIPTHSRLGRNLLLKSAGPGLAELLTSRHEALSSNPSAGKKKKVLAQP
jgi:hypothetical protein